MAEIAVITGTTHGIGRVTARELARAGRKVVMLCRDVRAGQAVCEGIRREVVGASVRTVRCDLSSLASVRTAAESVRRECPAIALLINNAGAVNVRHRMSVDGFELTFATNHLGPFLLTALLLDHLTPTARIVNVASRAHRRARADFAAVTDPRASYGSVAAYARSKLANILHALALARRLSGTRICVNCLHPGIVATNLLPRWLRLVKPLFSEVVDAERGARTTLHLALSEAVAGVTGCYFDEQQRSALASPLALDLELQETLWRMSARWTGAPEIAFSPANPEQGNLEHNHGSGRSTEVTPCSP